MAPCNGQKLLIRSKKGLEDAKRPSVSFSPVEASFSSSSHCFCLSEQLIGQPSDKSERNGRQRNKEVSETKKPCITYSRSDSTGQDCNLRTNSTTCWWFTPIETTRSIRSNLLMVPLQVSGGDVIQDGVPKHVAKRVLARDAAPAGPDDDSQFCMTSAACHQTEKEYYAPYNVRSVSTIYVHVPLFIRVLVPLRPQVGPFKHSCFG